jgi:hypothetical protein
MRYFMDGMPTICRSPSGKKITAPNVGEVLIWDGAGWSPGSVSGPQGPIGPQGPTGSQGPAGPQGPAGAGGNAPTYSNSFEPGGPVSLPDSSTVALETLYVAVPLGKSRIYMTVSLWWEYAGGNAASLVFYPRVVGAGGFPVSWQTSLDGRSAERLVPSGVSNIQDLESFMGHGFVTPGETSQFDLEAVVLPGTPGDEVQALAWNITYFLFS